MDIETKSLTACEVTPDGSGILLGFVDTDCKPATIRLSLNQVGALAMTLPELINKALRVRFDDQSLRCAYPLASWTVERSSDPATGMVTLSTVDGFTVCFSMRRRIARRTWRGAGHRVFGQNPGACELNRTVDWKVFSTPWNRCVYPCRGYPCSSISSNSFSARFSAATSAALLSSAGSEVDSIMLATFVRRV
jgi:hypothetical protein